MALVGLLRECEVITKKCCLATVRVFLGFRAMPRNVRGDWGELGQGWNGTVETRCSSM